MKFLIPISTFILGAIISGLVTWKAMEALYMQADLKVSTAYLNVAMGAHKELISGNKENIILMFEDMAMYEFGELERNQSEAIFPSIKTEVARLLARKQEFYESVSLRKDEIKQQNTTNALNQ
jgi:hypothetical protein